MIREITKTDFESFWETFSSIIEAQETYAFEPHMSFDDAYQLWCETPQKTFVFIDKDQVRGTYYIKPNAMGLSSHICNCGYMVANDARGLGVARKMYEHSQQIALELGYKAMQFNSVVSTNNVAVSLWKKLGFNIIGTIPKAYQHARFGLVDSYIMYKWLAND